MRIHFTTSWIFQGWITHLIVALCIQWVFSKENCDPQKYLKDRKCCRKCEPGRYVFAHCTQNSGTQCLPCGSNEYQPDWNNETKCFPQKFCDTGKGFSPVRPNNPKAAVPCQCKQGLQCSPINCEFCEKIPPCPPGQGLVIGESGRGSCVPCQYGYFSDSDSIDLCKPWTDCKANGKTEKQPGNAKSDVLCGPPFVGPSTSWVVVAVLSVIIVISLVILFLFCYKDKLKLLSVNLRTCVQNLKRSRIQQETLTPPYNSVTGPQSCPLTEITCLMPRQDDNPSESLKLCPKTRPVGGDDESTGPDQDRVEGSAGTPSEASEGGPASPLSGSSCSCVLSVNEPVEVGENEDCSQLVATGLAGPCSCGHGDVVGGEPGVERCLQEPPLHKNCGAESLAGCTDCADLQGSQDLYLDYSSPVGKDAMSEVRGCLGDGAQDEGLYRQNEPCCCSIDSTTVPALSSVSANDQGLSLLHSTDNKLSDPDSDPEYQSQCSEAALTSGQVTGNNNTTFISSGQVMNFSGEVIVVYVSQTSLGSGAGAEEPFSSPVQEESSEDSFQSIPKLTTDTPRHSPPNTQPERDLPVQEVTNEGRAAK